MDFQSLTALYATKADGELLRLAAESDHLTLEAQSALRGEMCRRQLLFEEAPTAPAPPPNVAVEKVEHPKAPPLHLPVAEFIGQVFQLYHEHLWLFLKLTFPAVLLGVVSIQTAQNIRHLILRPLAYGFWYQLVEGFFVNTAGFLVSWTAFCIAFAAICVAVRKLRSGSDISGGGAFGALMTKLSPILRVSSLLFTIFYVGALATEVILFIVLGRFVIRVLNAVPISAFASGFVVITAISLITSRLGLAVPAVVLDDFKVGRAFFLSDELTEKKWAILALLLTKSILGGYIAGMLPFWLARWIPASITLPSWFPWVLTGASVVAVTVVEPIMFIGFVLLYEKTTCRSLDAPHESTTHPACSG